MNIPTSRLRHPKCRYYQQCLSPPCTVSSTDKCHQGLEKAYFITAIIFGFVVATCTIIGTVVAVYDRQMHAIFGNFQANLYNCVGRTDQPNRRRRQPPQRRHSQPRRREHRPVRWGYRAPNCRPQSSRHGAWGNWPTLVGPGVVRKAFVSTVLTSPPDWQCLIFARNYRTYFVHILGDNYSDGQLLRWPLYARFYLRIGTMPPFFLP